MADLIESLTKALNPPQKEAVLHHEGPLLILAGAGSGKTRVLTHRMAHLIAGGFAAPEEVLCVTFTNKAAREMEHRIYNLLHELGVPVHSQLWISTFHSFCVRLLRQRIELLDYKPFFTIYDSSDQLAQIKKVMNALNINEKIFPAKNFQSRIGSAKMAGLSPQEVEKAYGRPLMDSKSLEVYKRYEEDMKRANALDFDDLLMKTWDLFRMYPDVLKEYQEKFRYIMVDEYQDTNRIQYLLVQALAKTHRNLCVVGDEDQSIYSWRGADIKNILDFEKDFQEAKVVKLEENYRSSANIVKAATSVIRNNNQRKDKTLFTSNLSGDMIRVQEERSEYDEARFVAKTIEEIMNSGEGSWNDFAVFYRTNAQSRVIEEAFRTNGIPYKIVGGVRFYERMEIKDVLSFMKLAVNPADDMAFKRIINVPTRGIGKTTLEKIENIANERRLTFFEAADIAVNERAFNSGTCSKIRRFLDLMFDLQVSAKQFPLQEFYHIVLDKTEYLKALKAEDNPEAEARMKNLEEFDNAIEQFTKERGEEAGLQGFLEEMALVSDQDSIDEQVNSVTLMTLHISKGLEYPVVFIVGVEENLFPSSRGGFDAESEDDLEEERRLAYVGMTRARQKLFLTHAKVRRVWGQEQSNSPSRFIKEIPKEIVDFRTSVQGGAFFNRYASGAYGSNGMSPRAEAGVSSRRSAKGMDDDSQAFPDYEEESSHGDGFRKGMKVRHPTFGVGSIYSTEGSGDQLKVSVLFTDQTIKKFVVKYARLERL
ncbi:MAG: UvrD-helicase domain-containing protein [Bdellovibrionaceae bacterium]|nr:UvrD-helicase domain-containing protein [Pseudobdellovibrionaceae bacterium]